MLQKPFSCLLRSGELRQLRPQVGGVLNYQFEENMEWPLEDLQKDNSQRKHCLSGYAKLTCKLFKLNF